MSQKSWSIESKQLILRSMISSIHGYCAKRHYVRECKTRNVLRSSVRKIIHFCGRHIGGGHMELLTGSLTHRFFGIPKVDPPKRALRLSIRRSRVPFFGHQKVTFLQNTAKNCIGIFTRCICYQYCTFSNWRCVTCAQRGYRIGGQVRNFVTDSTICFTYSFKLRAPAAHGVSSNNIKS